MRGSYLQEALGDFAGNLVVLVVRDALPLVSALEAQSTEAPVLIQGLVEHPVHGIGRLRAERFPAQAHSSICPGCPECFLCKGEMTAVWSNLPGLSVGNSVLTGAGPPCLLLTIPSGQDLESWQANQACGGPEGGLEKASLAWPWRMSKV